MGRKARKRLERRSIVGALVALLLVVSGVGAWLWSGVRTTPVEPAPRFNLLASTGRVIALDEFLDKQEVVLIFYMGAG